MNFYPRAVIAFMKTITYTFYKSENFLFNCFFLGGLIFVLLIVVGGTIYLKRVENHGAARSAHTEERIESTLQKVPDPLRVSAAFSTDSIEPPPGISKPSARMEDLNTSPEDAPEQSSALQLARIAALEKQVQENAAIIAEERAILRDLTDFNEWLAGVDMEAAFSDILRLRSLSKEDIRDLYSPEELHGILVEKAALFNSIREEFLRCLESYSPGARDLIYEKIRSNPEWHQIYQAYIEKPIIHGDLQ